MTTPRLTEHARRRCAEMGISTKVVKRIVQNPSLTRPTRPSQPSPEMGDTSHYCMAVSDEYPDYAVVFVPDEGVVVTVVFRTTVEYVRDGTTFIPEPKA